MVGTYDTDADAAYIRLSDHKVARTAEIDSGTLVDLDADGQVVGVEVIGPRRDWPLQQILDKFPVGSTASALLRASQHQYCG